MSNIINCPSCDKEVSKKSNMCLGCGHPIRPKQDYKYLGIIGVFFILFGLFFTPFLIIGLFLLMMYPLAAFHSYLELKGKNNSKLKDF